MELLILLAPAIGLGLFAGFCRGSLGNRLGFGLDVGLIVLVLLLLIAFVIPIWAGWDLCVRL